MSDELDLKSIEEKLDGISPWPWFKFRNRYVGAAATEVRKKTIIAHVYSFPYEHCSGSNNATFIAKVPEIVRDLIAEVKRLRKEITRFEIEHSEEEGYFG